MAEKTTVYEDLSIEKGVLEARIAQALSSDFHREVEVRITGEDKITRKYRGKSIAGKFTVEIYRKGRGGGHELEQLYIRKYRPGPDAEEIFRFDREMSIILHKCVENDLASHKYTTHWHTDLVEESTQRAVPAFLKPLGTQYPFFEKDLMAMTYFERRNPAFDQRILADKKCTDRHLELATDLSLILLDRIPHFINKYTKLKALPTMSHKKDPFAKDLGSDYARGFRAILGSMNLAEAEKERASSALDQLIEEYLDKDELRTIIMKDAYPWHNNTSHFFDVGRMCQGSRGLYFGALFGHPDVFLKIQDPSEISSLFRSVYLNKRDALMGQFHMNLNPINGVLLEKSFYVGAICANADLLAEHKDKMSSQELIDVIKAMKRQMYLLSDILVQEGEESVAAQVLHQIFETKEDGAILPMESKIAGFLRKFLGGSK